MCVRVCLCVYNKLLGDKLRKIIGFCSDFGNKVFSSHNIIIKYMYKKIGFCNILINKLHLSEFGY